MVAAAEDEQRKLIAVLLGCEKIEQRYKDAIALFEAGFNEKKVSRTLFSNGFDLFTCPIEGSKIHLQAYLSQDITLEYFPSEEPTFKTSVSWQVSKLPVFADQKVAERQILSSDNKLLSSAPLFAARTIEPSLQYQILQTWKRVKKGVWDHITLVMAAGGLFILVSTFYYSHNTKRKK